MSLLRPRRYLPITALAVSFTLTAGPHAAAVTLRETGSSLLTALFAAWGPAYAKANPDVQVATATAAAAESLAQTDAGQAEIAAADLYLTDDLTKSHTGMLNIPLVTTSQIVNYNLPGLNGNHLKLTGPVLAGIYRGKITKWNDPEIAKLNPTVKLPDSTIVPIHRSDDSDDTYIFTRFLSLSAPDWAEELPYGTSINWPAGASSRAAEGNQGMVNLLRQTPYALAYVAFAFKKDTDKARLGEALLQNRAGSFTLPTPHTISATLENAGANVSDDGRLDLVFLPGEQSYPMVACGYALVRAMQPNPQSAQDLKAFLRWAVQPNGGNADQFLRRIAAFPLPARLRGVSEAQIDRISG